MGKVYQFDNAVNHGVAQGYKGIDAPPGQPSEKKFKEIFHVWLLRLPKFIVAVVADIFLKLAGLKNQGAGLAACPLKKQIVVTFTWNIPALAPGGRLSRQAESGFNVSQINGLDRKTFSKGESSLARA
jgi:hypothetical protein